MAHRRQPHKDVVERGPQVGLLLPAVSDEGGRFWRGVVGELEPLAVEADRAHHLHGVQAAQGGGGGKGTSMGAHNMV